MSGPIAPAPTTLESSRDYAVFLLDQDGRVKTWNRGAELIHGYTAAEIVGRRIDVLYPSDCYAGGVPGQILEQAAAHGQAEADGWRMRKDGNRFWADGLLTAIRDGEGRLLGYANVTRDLSRMRRTDAQDQLHRQRLWHTEERFRLLVECVEDYAIFMLDPQGVVATWNAGAERIKGYRASEIIGRHFSVFRTPEDAWSGACQHELALALRDGKLAQEGWRVRKDGTSFWASVLLTALREPAGDLIGFAKITRDLSQRRQLEEERVQRVRAEEAVRLRDEFLLVASHELKTPLASLQIDVHALMRHAGAADQENRRLTRVIRSVERLSSLTESLLSVSRLAQGELVLHRAPMNLSEAAGQVVDTMREQSARAGCELRLLADGAVVGTWDRLRVEQVVMNLISNAVKYASGQPVSVSVAADGDQAVLAVRDRGPGLPPADVRRIFERFERASSIRHFGGLGLGLYISREIVAAHGGSIAAANHPDGGAELTVRLPLPTKDEETRGTAR